MEEKVNVVQNRGATMKVVLVVLVVLGVLGSLGGAPMKGRGPVPSRVSWSRRGPTGEAAVGDEETRREERGRGLERGVCGGTVRRWRSVSVGEVRR